MEAVINLVEQEDVQGIISIVEMTPVPCVIEPLDGGDVECRQGEPEGTPVDVLQMGACGGLWVRADAVAGRLRSIFDTQDLRLYAAYVPAESMYQYGALFSDVTHERVPGVKVYLNNGKVVVVTQTCYPVQQQLEQVEIVRQFIVVPPGG